MTGNLFPVTGIKKNILCHNTLFLWMKEYLLWQEINILSQEEQWTPVFDFLCSISKWAGAISKLIPWLCISHQSCHWVQLYVDYNLDDEAIFSPLFWAKPFSGKFGSHEISIFFRVQLKAGEASYCHLKLLVLSF